MAVAIARCCAWAKTHSLRGFASLHSSLAQSWQLGELSVADYRAGGYVQTLELPVMNLVTLWLALLCCTLVVLLAYLATDSERC